MSEYPQGWVLLPCLVAAAINIQNNALKVVIIPANQPRSGSSACSFAESSTDGIRQTENIIVEMNF